MHHTLIISPSGSRPRLAVTVHKSGLKHQTFLLHPWCPLSHRFWLARNDVWIQILAKQQTQSSCGYSRIIKQTSVGFTWTRKWHMSWLDNTTLIFSGIMYTTCARRLGNSQWRLRGGVLAVGTVSSLIYVWWEAPWWELHSSLWKNMHEEISTCIFKNLLHYVCEIDT